MSAIGYRGRNGLEHRETASQKLSLLVCHECDLLLRDAGLTEPGTRVVCPRCDAELYRVGNNSLEHCLALSFAAMLLLFIANLHPIVGLNIQGHQIETTVLGAARQLWQEGMPVVGALLFLTTVLMPLIELSALLWILFPLWRGYRPPHFSLVIRVLRLTHPWAMVEVFILGVLVSLVKLSHLADVLPGPAIWCFGALMLVLSALSSMLDHREIWNAWEAARS